jgi:hypothetical protein
MRQSVRGLDKGFEIADLQVTGANAVAANRAAMARADAHPAPRQRPSNRQALA